MVEYVPVFLAGTVAGTVQGLYRDCIGTVLGLCWDYCIGTTVLVRYWDNCIWDYWTGTVLTLARMVDQVRCTLAHIYSK